MSVCAFLSKTTTLERTTIVLTAAMVVLRLVVAATTLLTPDEGYYWLWTRPLHPGYYEHPPMVAYWIWAGTRLLGDGALGARVVAVAASFAVTVLAWDSARRIFDSRRAGALAALWLNCVLLFGVTGVIVTPDSPLMLFWALAVWATARMIGAPGWRWPLLAGAALGLGAMSKYTMALILPGVLAPFILFPALRHWWGRPHPYLAALLALVLMTPLLWWNLHNDFASFAKQLNHAMAAAPAAPWHNLATFLASQLGLVTPLIFPAAIAAMVWALWAGWRERNPALFLLGGVSLPVFVFFCVHVLEQTVQAHWAGPAYYGGIIALAGWIARATPSRRVRRGLIAAPALGAAVTVLVYLHAITALVPLPVRVDPVRRMAGWDQLAAAVGEERANHPGAFLFVQKHDIAGVLTFYLPDHPLVFLKSWKIRPSFYTAADVTALRGGDGLYLTRSKSDAAALLRPHFADVTVLREIPLTWRGGVADRYTLYLARGYKGGVFVRGDGLFGAMDTDCGKNTCPDSD